MEFIVANTAITGMFTTTIFATGVIADATGTPSAIVYKNGVATADSVTVSKVTTGIYKYTVTPTGFTAADIISIIAYATVSGVSQKYVAYEAICQTSTGLIPQITTMYGMFVTHIFETGALSDADSLPSMTLYKNGADSGLTVTVTKVSTGVYKYSSALTGFVDDDEISYVVTATVDSVDTGSAIVYNAKMVSATPTVPQISEYQNNTSGQVSVKWDSVGGASSTKIGYRLYTGDGIAEGELSYSSIDNSPADGDTVTITGLTDGYTYEFIGFAYAGINSSGVLASISNVLRLRCKGVSSNTWTKTTAAVNTWSRTTP